MLMKIRFKLFLKKKDAILKDYEIDDNINLDYGDFID